jgi:hypothetical protein
MIVCYPEGRKSNAALPPHWPGTKEIRMNADLRRRKDEVLRRLVQLRDSL